MGHPASSRPVLSSDAPEQVPFAGGITASAILKYTEQFIAAASGHKGDSLATIIGEKWFERRKANAEKVSEKTYFTWLKLGITPKDIPLNILEPAMEGASRADSDELRERWAHLLANAGDSRNQVKVEPVFTSMLVELSSREVVFLDSLLSSVKNTIINRNLLSLQILFRDKGLAKNAVPPAVAHFQQQATLDPDDTAQFEIMMDILTRSRILIENFDKAHGDFRFSQLGLAFVLACQPPAPVSAAVGA
jgi:hypothetical protein